jgi:hypothetical protein
MSSKTAPAYVLAGDLTDEERRQNVDAVKEHGDSPSLIVEETSDGQMLLLDPRSTRTLYHYTSQRHWERIQQDGYLRAGPHGFVALTDQPNLKPASPDAHWATVGPLDKTQVRITVITKEADPFSEYCVEHKIDPEWVARQTRQDTTEHWFVLDRHIPSGEWVEVRLGDTPIAKKALPRRRRNNDKPLWQTSFGSGSKCDFCGYDDQTACYRYECRPFELAGWYNGNPEGDAGESDWAACWMCAELVQKRDIQTLCARSDAEMIGEPVRSGGKHGTDSGIYSRSISHSRIAAFFQHYTKKRWFVGKCDFCSIRGESVHWQYECGAFSTTHPMSGQKVSSDSPWILCDACAKLTDANKQRALVERALEHQFTLMELETGMPLSVAYRTQARAAMHTWVALFFQKRRGKKHEVADLPPRVEIPRAPIPAQRALDEQTTLLRWLEGSDGRAYLGGWNDRYEGKPEWQWDRRVATHNELTVWTLPLRYGEAFYWEPRAADYIRQAAAELAANPDVPFFMRPQILPAPYGFFYSNEPFGESADFPCRAIGWAIFEDAHARRQTQLEQGGTSTEMEVQMWPTGGGDPSQADGIILTFWSERPQDSTLRPSGQLLWSFGVDFRKVIGFTSTSEAGPEQGLTPEQSTMVAALFQFIQQRIVIAGRGQPVGSAIRKRIEREYPEHLQTVRVITLRRTQRADYRQPDEPTDRTISVSFKVHGFWRNQCFNTAGHADAEKAGIGCNDHMTIYVHDYLKGGDLPLAEGSERVFDVAR